MNNKERKILAVLFTLLSIKGTVLLFTGCPQEPKGSQQEQPGKRTGTLTVNLDKEYTVNIVGFDMLSADLPPLISKLKAAVEARYAAVHLGGQSLIISIFKDYGLTINLGNANGNQRYDYNASLETYDQLNLNSDWIESTSIEDLGTNFITLFGKMSQGRDAVAKLRRIMNIATKESAKETVKTAFIATRRGKTIG